MASCGPLKGGEGYGSAQKALQGPEAETREMLGGEKCFPDQGSLISPPGKSMISYQKANLENLS